MPCAAICKEVAEVGVQTSFEGECFTWFLSGPPRGEPEIESSCSPVAPNEFLPFSLLTYSPEVAHAFNSSFNHFFHSWAPP